MKYVAREGKGDAVKKSGVVAVRMRCEAPAGVVQNSGEQAITVQIGLAQLDVAQPLLELKDRSKVVRRACVDPAHQPTGQPITNNPLPPFHTHTYTHAHTHAHVCMCLGSLIVDSPHLFYLFSNNLQGRRSV